MNKKLYSGHAGASNEFRGGSMMESRTYTLFAISEAEATGILLLKAKEDWPAIGGWHAHFANVALVPEHMIRRAFELLED